MKRGFIRVSAPFAGFLLASCSVLIDESASSARLQPPIRIDEATLGDGGRTLRLDFTGGPEFDPTNPCTVQYEVDVQDAGDVLQVGIYALRHPATPVGGVFCTDEGHFRSLIVSLEEPFGGTQIRDLAGQVIEIQIPRE